MPFLGRVPLDPQIVEDSDAGTPYVLRQPESDAARAFARVVELVMQGTSGEAGEMASLSTEATNEQDTGVSQ